MKRYYRRGFFSRLSSFIKGKGNFCAPVHEYEMIRLVREAGVPTMREIVCGHESDLLGVTRGYVIVSAVPGDALERCGKDFLENNESAPDNIRQLTDELVHLVAKLHNAGFVHRDLYASHIFLNEHDGILELNLIDLARAFRPAGRYFRWRAKDLAQLKYSMPQKWVDDHWEIFLGSYLKMTNQSDRDKWNRAISRRVRWMKQRESK